MRQRKMIMPAARRARAMNLRSSLLKTGTALRAL